jgi:hypothetical protein
METGLKRIEPIQNKAVKTLSPFSRSAWRHRCETRAGWLADLRKEFAAGTYHRDEGEIAVKVIQEYLATYT